MHIERKTRTQRTRLGHITTKRAILTSASDLINLPSSLIINSEHRWQMWNPHQGIRVMAAIAIWSCITTLIMTLPISLVSRFIMIFGDSPAWGIISLLPSLFLSLVISITQQELHRINLRWNWISLLSTYLMVSCAIHGLLGTSASGTIIGVWLLWNAWIVADRAEPEQILRTLQESLSAALSSIGTRRARQKARNRLITLSKESPWIEELKAHQVKGVIDLKFD